MQDIDFDEIDRAVNSITNSSTDAQANSVPTLGVSPVVSGPAEPGLPYPAEAPSPAARRSSGRFMDVVHPSSDMRPPILDRAAPTVIPVPDFQREEVAERYEVAGRPEPAAVIQSQSSAFHWPDPIDMPAPASTPIEQPGEVTEVIEPSSPEPAAEVTEEPPVVTEPDEEKNELDDAAPLESPFLMDTKVEKRPLGAFSGADAGLPLLEDPIPPSANVSPSPEVALTAEEPAHEEHEEMPHELHEDLLALEGHDQKDGETEPSLEAANPVEQVSPEPAAATTVEDIPVGPTSIVQQYKEQPSSDSQQSGSIFDTEAYHQALTHPPKKRSSILIIVWIIALILVGGGIGAGIYFFVLPMLG